MKNFSLSILCILAALCGIAANAQTESEDPSSAAPAGRSGTVTTLLQRGEYLQGTEDIVWFEVADQRRWLARIPAMGAGAGSLLLVASEEASANGNHHLATLRRTLPHQGWLTYFFNLRADQDVEQQIQAAVAQLPEDQPLVLICEGLPCEALRTLAPARIGARVFLNLPLSEVQPVAAGYRDSWQASAQPTLILQEQPQGWPAGLPLLGGYELHILPASNVGLGGNKIERKIRGWFKRQLRAG